jgi:hypothetical protein
MESTNWQVMGEYFESCNCEVVCPCLISSQPMNTVWPTYTHCDLALAFYVETGHYGDVNLAGLTAVVMAYTPGKMINPDWSTAYYIDERANPQQREAMSLIFTGKVGGPLADVAAATQYDLGVKFVPIQYVKDGKKRTVVIPDIADLTIKAKPGVDPAQDLWHENAHPFAYRISQAVAEESHYKDHRLIFDNSGRNGFFGDFEWVPETKVPRPVKR